MPTRIFTRRDQADFAKLSGDNNPVHLDEMAARRLLFGRTVVHGMHLLLCSLDGWFQQNRAPATIKSLRVHFMKPVGLEEPVQFACQAEKSGRVKMEVTANGSLCAKVIFEWSDVQPTSSIQIPSQFPLQRPPEDVPVAQLAAKKSRLNLYLEAGFFTTTFPHLAKFASPSLAATLLATTRLVGVECPGLHSVYSELSLTADASEQQPIMTYEVTTFAERYGQVCMKIAAPELSGEIKALVRPPPQRQPSYAACRTGVGGFDFSGQRALVIGGSRGLGEITAKILCAGGADTMLTYHSGLDDATRVAHEITGQGGQVDCIRYDVLNPAVDDLRTRNPGWAPTHLYYFATPFISPSVKGKFSPALFDKFCNYYVSGFANTVNLFRPFGLRNVFYPSTAYLDDIPPNMVEYASAKAAGETLCAFYQKEFQEMAFFTSRLPRMATDQTAGLPMAQNADALPVLIQALGQFRKFIAG
jgi:hypothetical protein